MKAQLTVSIILDLARRFLESRYIKSTTSSRTGRIPPGRKSDKFRLYTEDQARGIETWYMEYMRLDAGCCGNDEE